MADENNYETIKYVLEYRLFRHPIIIGAVTLFVFGLIFFAFGTIKFQSLALDIDRQGQEALKRSLAHIKTVEDNAKSNIKLTKTTAVTNIKSLEITAKSDFNQEAGPLIENSLKLIKLESKKAVGNIDTDGKAAIYDRVKELHAEIEHLKGEVKTANQSIENLKFIKSEIVTVGPEVDVFLKNWKALEKRGGTWQAAFMRTVDDWRKLIIELIIISFVSCGVAYAVSKK